VPIIISNVDATNDLYLGGVAVTTATGWKLAKGTTLSMNLNVSDQLWGIANVAGVAIQIMVGRQ
jgi:hypothetical protein